MKNICYVLHITLLMCTNQAFGSEAGMPQLDSEFWAAQIFWLVLIFSLLYFLIWKFFLPKITYSIENRKSRIVNDIDQAQKLKEDAEKKLIEYNEIINKSKKDAKKIIDDAKKSLDSDIAKKKLVFDNEIEKELASVEKEIKELKKNSLTSMKQIAEDTSAEIIKQIVNIEVNKSNVSAIVNDIVKKEIKI
jgi:F-type H+-transporting ATPase subunit b